MTTNNLAERNHIIQLLSIYGNLLTETQRELLKDYYDYDLSLSEIGEEKGISRAAISNALHSGVKKMEEFETSLHILENKKKFKDCLEHHKDDLIKISEEYVDGI